MNKSNMPIEQIEKKECFKELNKNVPFWSLVTIYFILIAIRFYYLAFTSTTPSFLTGTINTKLLVEQLSISMIIWYIDIVFIPQLIYLPLMIRTEDKKVDFSNLKLSIKTFVYVLILASGLRILFYN